MAIRSDFTAGEVLAAADLNDTFLAKANLASPTFTGTPAGPTAASGTNTTQLATTAFVQGAGGLVLVASESFSAVSSLSINGCFTSSHQNYRIIVATDDPATAQTFTMRLRASSTDDSSSNYYRLSHGQNAGGAVTQTGQSSSFFVAFAGSGSQCFSDFSVFRPQNSTRTAIAGDTVSNNSGFNGITGWNIAGWFDLSTQFDGFSLLFNASTTGTIRVYGYKNS